MKNFTMILLATVICACGQAPGAMLTPAVPTPNECTNTAPNIASETDGSYTDLNGCETTVLNHQVVSNVQGAACQGWC